MKKLKFLLLGVVVGLLFGLWFGVNIGKEKPIFSNPFEDKALQEKAKETVVMGPKWEGHSVYTYHLIQGLKGKADDNKDGVTTVRELQVFLDDKVPKDAKQTPQFNYLGTGEGQFVFYSEGAF